MYIHLPAMLPNPFQFSHLCNCIQNGNKEVSVVVAQSPLNHGGEALKAHPSVHVVVGQREKATIRLPVCQ